MDWISAEHIEENKYNLPGNWLKIEYFEALNLLFRIENSLRVFIYIILKLNLKNEWKHAVIKVEDSGENLTISKIAKQRLNQDNNFAYLGHKINSELLHLTSNELTSIIMSDNYWKYFQKYFTGSKDIMKMKLDEIGNIRNSLAHFRPLKQGDVGVLKQNSSQALSLIELEMNDIISCHNNIPSNFNEEWYKKLSELSNDSCKIFFKYSKNQEWIKIGLKFNIPVIGNIEDLFIDSINIESDKIFTCCPDLQQYVIYYTEEIPSGRRHDSKLDFYKILNFAFNKNELVKNFEKIKKLLNKIITQVSEDIELIKKDKSAKGVLVELTWFMISYGENDDGNTFVDIGSTSSFLLTKEKDNLPIEFWSQLNWSYNFFSNSEKLPWIPVTISEDKSRYKF